MKFEKNNMSMSTKSLKQTNKNVAAKKINKYAYILIAFHQGLSYISQLAVQYFFKDELKVEPHKLSQINSIIHLPWAIKPILGLTTDFLPIFGYRRKIYVILCGILNLLCWLYMAFYINTAAMACTMIFFVNLTLSFCSVLGEAIVVELSQLETEDKDSKAKDLVSLFFLSRTIGELLSAYLKGLFVDIMPLRTIFLIGSTIPTLLIISGLMLIEKRVGVNEIEGKKLTHNNSADEDEEKCKLTDENLSKNNDYGSIMNLENQANQENSSHPQPPEKSLFKEFFTFLCQKYILLPLMFIIIFKATPSYYDPFFYFISNELKINATSLGKISFCSTIAILIAIMIYKAYLKNCNFKTMIVIGTVISFLISLACYLLVLRVNLQLGIPDFWLLLFTNSFLSMVGEFVLLPILSLACVLCPKKLEGTVYSVFMSSLNLGGILSHLNGGILTSVLNISSKDYSNLHWLILISKISSLLPLPMLYCIDDKYFHPEKKENEENVKNFNMENEKNPQFKNQHNENLKNEKEN